MMTPTAQFLNFVHVSQDAYHTALDARNENTESSHSKITAVQVTTKGILYCY